MINLENKLAVITGAARGIGFAIAESFIRKGADVIILDIDKEQVDQAVAKLKTGSEVKVSGYAADVTDEELIGSTFKEIVNEHGKIDILINNAGVTRDGLLMKMRSSDWDMVLDVNLKGTFICTQKVSRYMLKQRSGVIINMASIIGIMGNAGQANYAASKGGIIAFTKSAAKEFASRNVRVNAVAPGFIRTDMTATLPDEIVKKYAELIPLKRMGDPKDIADLCLFLASDSASYITGQTITIDGGMYM